MDHSAPPLPPLLPEAEPPLPAAHAILRARTPPGGHPRREPTPMRVALERELTPTPQKLPAPAITATLSTPLPSTPGPLVDPGSWFAAPPTTVGGSRRGTRSRGMIAPDPPHEVAPEMLDAAAPLVDDAEAAGPIAAPAPPQVLPALGGRGAHRAAAAALLCVVVGIAVGWLLSAP